MPFIIMQQVQPADMQSIMHWQWAWIILAIIASPLVHVMVQPMSVISILHMPHMAMLCMQHIVPFIMQHMVQAPPCIIIMRLFIISAAVRSSQVIVQRMPPVIFSIIMVQRGGIIMPGIMDEPIPIMPGIMPMPPIMGIDIIPDMPVPIIPPIIRSDVMLFMLLMVFSKNVRPTIVPRLTRLS